MSSLLEKLYSRRNPQGLVALSEAKAYGERRAHVFSADTFSEMEEGDTTKYVVGCMQPIDSYYTDETIAVGERVRDHLMTVLPSPGVEVEFAYQGSVTNETHIRWKSDLDVLVIHRGFVSLEPPRKATSPYKGNPADDLRQLRTRTASAVRTGFPDTIINQNGSKCISIAGGTLGRKLDLIICNWWNTNDFVSTREKKHRGVHVLDLNSQTRVRNKPFLHNAKIADLDLRVNGGLRKAIRFMKSLKYDFNIPVSSYDLASIGCHVPEGMLSVGKGKELLLAENTLRYLRSLEEDASARESMKVPNGMRLIFCDEGATLEGLRQIVAKMSEVVSKAGSELAESARTISATKLRY